MIIRPCIAVAVILTITLRGIECLYCLTCDDVVHARDCDTIKKCGASEMCFHTSVVAPSGRITRRLGCRDRLQCPHATVGRRTSDVVKREGDIILCNSCCDQDFCQTKLCSDQDFPGPHGPICFNCDSQIIDDCNKIQVCGRDQVCSESLADRTGTGDVVKMTGCYGKMACENIKMAMGLGKRDVSESCYTCCDTNLCNNNCTMATQPPPTVSPGTNGTAINVTVPACVDSTSLDICKVAAQYVCQERDKADHANCLHYCGFC